MKKIICLCLSLALCLCFAACGAEKASADKDVSLAAVMDEIRSTVTLPEMMDLSGDNLMDYFGIDASEISDSAVCINANGYEKEEVVLLKAADENAVNSLVEKLNSSLENAAIEMQNYIPEQYDLIQQSSVRTDGLYVSLCISENADQVNAILDSYLK